MAAVAELRLDLTVSPDLEAVVRALEVLRLALEAHGHVFTDDEHAALKLAADVLERVVVVR